MPILGLLLVVVGLVWSFWPHLTAWWATWRTSPVAPVQKDADGQAAAFVAVHTLVAYFRETGHTVGEISARRCGAALFEEPPSEA